MTKVLKYLLAYALWIVDLGLGLWLFFISRTAFLDTMALFYRPGNFAFANRVEFADKVVLIILGVAWLIFMIVSEEYYRASALTGELLQRFARVTGILLLSVFAVDLILFWVQGAGNTNWLRLLILAAELSLGAGLIVAVRNRLAVKL